MKNPKLISYKIANYTSVLAVAIDKLEYANSYCQTNVGFCVAILKVNTHDRFTNTLRDRYIT